MRKLLLVDDQPHILRVLRLALEREGYMVEMARDGEQALEKLRASSYDVLITDVQMPRMDGRELCESMHAELVGAKPFTLVVTARAEDEIPAWVSKLPQTELLEKPFSLRRLTCRLAKLFARIPAPAVELKHGQ